MVAGVSVLALVAGSVAPGWAAPARPPKEADVAAYLADKPPALQPFFRSAMVEGERNRVLNLNRAGLAALQMGDDATAAYAFDEALKRIEAIYADNANAEKARSKFVKEATKDFKGEPYERVMAYYYRGIVYLRAGDYENARASFQQGQLQDAFAEDQKYKSDYAMLEALSGWASHCLGDEGKAAEFYATARELRPTVAIPNAADRTLLLADIGTGPEKWSDGQYQENLRFRGADYEEGAVVFLTPAAEQALLGQAQASVEAFGAAEQARVKATETLQARTQAVSTSRVVADASAKALESAFGFAPAAAPVAEVAPAAPAAKLTPAAAKAAAAAAKLAAREEELERLGLERMALNSAIAADQAETAIAAAETNAKEAEATYGATRQGRAAALAALQPYGLQLTDAAAAWTKAPAAPVAVAATGEILLWQASTRGGRMIDSVLAGKAAFKEGATQFADGMTQASLIALQTTSTMAQQAQSLAAQGYNVNTSGMQTAAYAGAAFMAIGLLSQMAANAAKPQADIRYWDSLPGELRYATIPGGQGQFKAVLQNKAGGYSRTETFDVKADPQGRCAVGWVRSRSALNVPPSAPNSEITKR